jgi:dynein heavy chain
VTKLIWSSSTDFGSCFWKIFYLYFFFLRLCLRHLLFAATSRFEIQINKMYNMNALMEDVAQLFRLTGQQGVGVTWIFTESHIKHEDFLEIVNSILMSGEVNNLFPKDELNLMVADLRSDMAKQRPDLVDNTDNLIQYFTERVRQNLHLVLCMSPMNPKFSIRARRFPGMINGTMIDYFLTWPQSALEGVANGIIDGYEDLGADTVSVS